MNDFAPMVPGFIPPGAPVVRRVSESQTNLDFLTDFLTFDGDQL
jgi:hypothetical protein